MMWLLDSNIGVKWLLQEEVHLNLRGTFPFIIDLASLP
jgi:hypothetical protein